jgi:prepilin-type processing-associated H-X9-DG protein
MRLTRYGLAIALMIAVLGTTGCSRYVSRSQAQAHDRSQQALCTSSLMELAVAANLYADDHGGTLPRADTWVKDLRQYFKDAEALRCPKAPDLPVAYAMNRALSGRRLADIKNPASTPLFFESDLGGPNPAGGVGDIAPPRHGRGNNFAFADGHVALIMPPRDFPSFGKWAPPDGPEQRP